MIRRRILRTGLTIPPYITFGVAGFRVYVLIDGVPAIDDVQGPLSYLDYRREMMHPGRPGLWSHSGAVGETVFNYPEPVALYSDDANGVFDPRDFGWWDIPPVTGSMAAGGTVLTLTSAREFRIGDQIIVELGGEAGGGKRNTVGVGGVTPQKALRRRRGARCRYRAGQRHAGLSRYGRRGVRIQCRQMDPANLGGSFYIGVKSPRSLVARVTGIDGAVLTLDKPAAVATSGASVWLDLKPALYPLTTEPAEVFLPGRSDGLTAYSNMTLALPAGSVRGIGPAPDQGREYPRQLDCGWRRPGRQQDQGGARPG